MTYRAVNNEVLDGNGTVVCVCNENTPGAKYGIYLISKGCILDGCGLAERIARLLNEDEKENES